LAFIAVAAALGLRWPLALGAEANPSAAPGVAQQQAREDVPPVTVQAQRAEFRRRLTTFVSTITRRIPVDEAVRRWNAPVCPLVTGLARDKGEFILQRLSQIAVAAGVPLDSEKCSANLAVVVTSDPDTLIRAWGEHRRAVTGLRETPQAFRRFQQSRRPVRVWRNHDWGGLRASPGTDVALQLGAKYGDVPSSGLIGSKLFVTEVLAVASAVVIVDARQIVGVQIGQLADYIAVVSLAEPDPDVPLETAPTILSLFSARDAGEEPPAGLSPWDQAFLKALYNTSPKFTTQRSEIATKMMSDLAP
jgi:hypothetical protein